MLLQGMDSTVYPSAQYTLTSYYFANQKDDCHRAVARFGKSSVNFGVASFGLDVKDKHVFVGMSWVRPLLRRCTITRRRMSALLSTWASPIRYTPPPEKAIIWPLTKSTFPDSSNAAMAPASPGLPKRCWGITGSHMLGD